jgi:tripartite-type tricarboxylate transporter receptor subunit TctC
VIARLAQEMAQVLRLPDVTERMAADGVTVVASSPDEFAGFLKLETAKYARIIQAAGIQASD